MLEIPFWILPLVYGIGVIIFFIWGFFYVFLMVRFGLFDARGRLYTAFFLIFTVANIGLVSLAVIQIDWFETIPLSMDFLTTTSPTFSL